MVFVSEMQLVENSLQIDKRFRSELGVGTMEIVQVIVKRRQRAAEIQAYVVIKIKLRRFSSQRTGKPEDYKKDGSAQYRVFQKVLYDLFIPAKALTVHNG
jgi:hypothetical protein